MDKCANNIGLKINLDALGVMQVPNGLCGVQHDYGKWSESSWQDKLNLTQDTKENISQVCYFIETCRRGE